MRDYAGGSAQAMAAAFLGFGAIANEVGLDLWQGLVATGIVALIPAQMAMADLYQHGAGLTAIMLAVAFIGARLMPMSMALMPMLREGARRPGILYFAAFPLASTSWTYAMRRCPDLPPDQRLPYFLAFAWSNVGIILVATSLGYVLADRVSPAVTGPLILVTPIFFMLLFIAESPHRSGLFALALGVPTAPLIHMVTPEWSLLLTGLVAGTLGFVLGGLGKHGDG